MPKTSQFQNLVLQQTLQDYLQQPTMVQPALTLPIKREALVPLPPAQALFAQAQAGRPTAQTTGQQRNEALPSTPHIREEIDLSDLSDALLPPLILPLPSRKKKQLLRGVAILVSALLILAIYLAWHAATPTSASPTVTLPPSTSLSNSAGSHPTGNTTSTATSAGATTIQVYIVGAIKHPGVYILPADSRVYQLIKTAGGPQPNADLVSLNLAAKLVDGQEIYVLTIGETPPASITNPAGPGTGSTPGANTGALVNINTATETEMTQALHISSTTAKKIIDYRTQHGSYTSIDQLLQVVSQTIYDRIKNLVTV